MSIVLVKNGSYRGIPVINTKFKLVKGFQTGKKGNYLTVRNDGVFTDYPGIEIVKIKVEDHHDFELVNGGNTVVENVVEPVVQESDEDAFKRIRTRFGILDEMSKACIDGKIRGMIVTGPPGVGKSHGVITQLDKASMFDKIKGEPLKYEIIKGSVSAIGLYMLLYRFSQPKHVLVFDDCDLWDDIDAMNHLKGALDSGKSRRICHFKDSRLLREEKIPNSFEFLGSIIFITNKVFDAKKATKIQPHLDALQSRSHFLDLSINTQRDKILRIKQVHNDSNGGLFANYMFKNNEDEMILDYMWENKDRLRELSMRMAIKIADLIKVNPRNWKMLAENTVMINS